MKQAASGPIALGGLCPLVGSGVGRTVASAGGGLALPASPWQGNPSWSYPRVLTGSRDRLVVPGSTSGKIGGRSEEQTLPPPTPAREARGSYLRLRRGHPTSDTSVVSAEAWWWQRQAYCSTMLYWQITAHCQVTQLNRGTGWGITLNYGDNNNNGIIQGQNKTK